MAAYTAIKIDQINSAVIIYDLISASNLYIVSER